MTAEKRSKNPSTADRPRLDLDQWLPQLLDHFMSTWNNKLDHELKEIRLTFPQWRILLITSQRGPLNIRQLSNTTLVPHSTLARWTRHMEKAGLVRSGVIGGDKRAVEISITAKGRRTFAKAFPIAYGVYAEALKGFTDADRQMLVGMLHRLRKNIGMK